MKRTVVMDADRAKYLEAISGHWAEEIKLRKHYEQEYKYTQEEYKRLNQLYWETLHLIELLYPLVCPDEYAAEIKAAQKVKNKGELVQLPKAVGLTKLSSVRGRRQWQFFVLVDDGRVIPIPDQNRVFMYQTPQLGPLGFYYETQTTEIPSVLEVLAKKLPFVKADEIGKKVPECYNNACQISASPIKDSRFHGKILI